MILYHAITNYHILCCILHKIIYNNDKECILYISSINKDKQKLTENIKKTNIFKNVEIYKEYNFGKIQKNKNFSSIINEISNHTKKNINIKLNDIEEFNICGDQYSLGLYLIYNKKKYNYFEEACGILSKSEIVKNNVKNISQKQYEITKLLKAYGESDFVKTRYGDLSQQKEDYHNEKDKDFSIKNILKQMPKKDIKRIINIFQGEKYLNINDNTDLLLTQHFINMGFMKYNEQKNLYTLLVDYFSKTNNLVIKPHPSDIHGLYKEWFPNSIIINRTMPSELLPYCFDVSVERGITASSTAILGLENVKESICFNDDIEKLYPNINRYYIVLKILLKILNKDEEVYLMGCYKDFFINLAKSKKIKLPEMIELEQILYGKKQDKRKIFIVDNLNLLSKTPRADFSKFQHKLKKDDIVIYINSNNKAYFYSENHFSKIKNIVPITINKKALRDDVEERLLEEELLYFYSSNDSVREVITNMKETIKLENTGIELEVNQKERIEIKTLEGILKATEERLLEEIKKNKKLRKENEKLLNSTSWKMTKPFRKIKKAIKKAKA